jgi:hypothetical protein
MQISRSSACGIRTLHPCEEAMKMYHTAYRLAARPLLAAAIFLLLPLVAMRFTAEVRWTLSDFVFAGVLILAVGIPLELVLRTAHDRAYRTAAILALGTTFLLLWSNGAVGITDSDADALYLLMVAVGVVGALLAGFRAAGMARVMAAMALAQTGIGVGALLVGRVPAYDSAFEILGLTAFFVAPFVGSALLFRRSARRAADRSAA